MRDGILARMKPNKNFGETAARLCQLHMEAGNSLATASRLIVGNTLLVTGVDLRKERGMSVSTAAAVAGRRSAWAAVVPMLVQRTYSSCSSSQEKTRKELLAHPELCCDTWVTSLFHCF